MIQSSKAKECRLAYFSAEIGISEKIPTYSGGLGVLAGDHIKASADRGLSMVGVTLLYKEGYFKQGIDNKGIQSESYPRFDPESHLKKLTEKFTLRLRDRDVWIQPYEYECKGLDGHIISIYFLDTDIYENIDDDRIMTLRLYSGNKDHRILQEAILGFGGIKLLKILRYDNIETYHMNEGHCSFITIALLEQYKGDENKVRSLCHFTTHTPVEAGHDHFSLERCSRLLYTLLPDTLQLPSWVQDNRLHMTELGLFFSRSANGVSRLHGQVAQEQFPDFRIDYITNGIYHPHWLGTSFQELFDRKISDWRLNSELLLDLAHITDDELVKVHQSQKELLLDYIHTSTHTKLSHDILTIGFARRAAEYKRARLIFSDLDRLIKLGTHKIQIVFAGKAHPKDQGGKDIIHNVVKNANLLADKVKVVYLENYNIQLGRLITSGVDVWLNTPLRPNEASGTSGMKAAINGIPNLSILDGWWAEGCRHNKNGWAIGSADICDDISDAESLYQLLEDEVIPLFYTNREKWIQMMRQSIQTSVKFTAQRMIMEYEKKFYNKHSYNVLNFTR